jgi:hypothetical protein
MPRQSRDDSTIAKNARTMNSQATTVMVAFLAGLALAIPAQVLGVMLTGDITPLDTSDPFNGGILGYWAGAFGGLPLIFAVIAIVATARKSGLRNSVLSGLGAVVGTIGVSVAVCGTVIAVASARPNKDGLLAKELPFADAGANRDSFVRGASRTCAKNQQGLAKNEAVSAAAIDAFCSCYGNSLADIVTSAEVAYMEQNKAPAASMVEKINTVVEKCTPPGRGQR